MDILSWIRDKMYTDGAVDPSLVDYDPLDPASSLPPAPKRLTTTGRIIKGIPGILQSGIAAAATPNIAYGGPTDIFRGMQAGQESAQDRDLLNYNLNRQQRQDAAAHSQKGLEDAIKWAQLENTKENTASLIDQRKQQQEDRANTLKLNELNRYLQLGQSGAQQMDEGTPASTEQITPGISLETNAQPPKPVPFSFKDPFSGKTLVLPQKNGRQKIDPDLGKELGIAPDDNGDYLATSQELSARIHNITRQQPAPKPEWDAETRAALIAVGAEDPSNPTRDEMEKALVRKAQLHVGEHPPPAPKDVPASTQDRRDLAAARQKVFVENGNDWNKVLQNLGKYVGDPVVAPWIDQINDHAQKQVQQGAAAAKANSAIDLLQKRANNASATGGRILKKIQDLQANYPKLMAGGALSAVAGSTAIGHPVLSRLTLPQDFIKATRQLQSDIAMFFQQQPPLEGYRAATAAEKLKQAAGADGSGVFANPDAVAGAISEIMDVNRQLANGLKTGKFPEGVQLPAELAAAVPTASAPGPGPQNVATGPPPGTVAVTRKDGKQFFVPAAKAQDPAYMNKFGYTLAQQ